MKITVGGITAVATMLAEKNEVIAYLTSERDALQRIVNDLNAENARLHQQLARCETAASGGYTGAME